MKHSNESSAACQDLMRCIEPSNIKVTESFISFGNRTDESKVIVLILLLTVLAGEPVHYCCSYHLQAGKRPTKIFIPLVICDSKLRGLVSVELLPRAPLRAHRSARTALRAPLTV